MQSTTGNIQPGPIDQHQLAAHRYQCHHIFPDGARCGSPALRNETRCYYHHETRKPVSNPRDRNARMNAFEFPFPDSRTSIQATLGDLMLRIGSNDIDPRRAGLLLYCLQLAQANLKASELAHHQQSSSEGAPAFSPAAQQSSPEGAPGFSPVKNPPVTRGFSPGPSEGITAQVQTEVSSLEYFAQKSGEGEATKSNDTISDPTPAPEPEAATPVPISRATFAALLESLARHHGIDVDDPIYTNHNEDSPILAALRAEAEPHLYGTQNTDTPPWSFLR
jgi:hypothetical protein